MSVVGSTSSLMSAMALALASRQSAAPVSNGIDLSALRAVRKLARALDDERAARAALERDNKEMRSLIEDLVVEVTRLRNAAGAR
jgi:hypothetical protein